MPTATGGETIGERLKNLRTELVRVKATIARGEDNGAAYTIAGQTQVTEISYDRALRRRRELEREIAGLERRLVGGRGSGLAVTKTVTP